MNDSRRVEEKRKIVGREVRVTFFLGGREKTSFFEGSDKERVKMNTLG
jgi:hypothetical protein